MRWNRGRLQGEEKRPRLHWRACAAVEMYPTWRRRIADGLSYLKEEEQLLDRSAPARWKRVLSTNPARQHRQDVSANARKQLELRKALAECEDRLAKTDKPALEQALREHDGAERALRSRRKIWSAKKEELERLGEILDHPAAPERLADLDQDQVQIDGLWHQDELAALRSALLEAALTLHEAWLADVGRKGGGFGGNIVAITKLLSNNNPVDDKHIASIWQSLFMIVPIVSTTFASFAKQFRGLGPGSIGWVFIDEAGQAVPQAAVGALLRARRVMVIGDPLQIEPVFTLPSALIAGASALSPHTAAGQYSPNRASVQMLADAANRYGTTLQGEEADGLWIGSPLRVHRRCIDPMFSLANQIAYQNKMIFGLQERRPAGDASPFFWRQRLDRRQGQSIGQTGRCRTDRLRRRPPRRDLSPGWCIAGHLSHLAVQGDQDQFETGSFSGGPDRPRRICARISSETAEMASGTGGHGPYLPGQGRRYRFHGPRRRCRTSRSGRLGRIQAKPVERGADAR